jgi:hypothetical protein
MEPKSLAQWSECAGAESGCFRILRGCLVLSSMCGAPRGPFYSPKAARSRWRSTWKVILAFCRVAHRTGPVDYPVRDLLPNLAYPTVAPLGWLAHRTLSDAHRTVRCTNWPLEQSTCRAKITRPTIGAGDRWLTGQFGAPPDSPVIFSRTPLLIPESSTFIGDQPGAPDTVRCAPDSPVCQTELKFGCTEPSLFSFFSFSFLTVSST